MYRYRVIYDNLSVTHGSYIKENTVNALLKFSRPLESAGRSGDAMDHYFNYISTREIRDKFAKCKRTHKDLPVYRAGNGAYYYSGPGNFSTVLNEFILSISYSAKSASLPDSDPCSVMEAKRLHKEIVDRLALK